MTIHLDEATHSYWLGEHRFAASVTEVLRASKGAAAIAAIEATRDQWAPRGVAVHAALEAHLKFDPWRGWHPDLHPPCWPYLEWVVPLITHPLWREVAPIASEQRVGCRELDIAGTFDGAWVDAKGRRILFDLKTQGNPESGPYDTRAQLGGYLVLAERCGIPYFHAAATIWARPGKVRLQMHETADCICAWWDAWKVWRDGPGDHHGAILL